MGQFKYLIKVESIIVDGKPTNNNKFYKMTENDNGKFTVVYGRIGCDNPITDEYDMDKWDKKLREKLSPRKGYEDKTPLFAEIKTTIKANTGVVATDSEVADIIILLQGYAKQQTVETYQVSAEAVTQKQIDAAQAHIDELNVLAKRASSPSFDLETFNVKLQELFKIIPRKMKHVGEHLIYAMEGYWDTKGRIYVVTGGKKKPKTFSEEILKLLADEQSNLYSMAGQVSQNSTTDDGMATKQHTMLDALGIQMTPVTDRTEFDMVKKQAQVHSKKVLRVFKIINKGTQKAFDDCLRQSANKKTELFWHGSRNQNWWFIIQQGLKIRPSGAIHTGSMFGDGIYFASECDKSMGYTDSGRWVNGGKAGKVYMALYNVHVGKQHIITRHDHTCSSLDRHCKTNGFNSVWAKKGAGIVRDEYVIYKSCQSTIQYLVEFNDR